ncbi:MAG TPA: hypothetical protein VEA69_16580 [Tepidisphaeraceae bacterium]|nr:hypothetical protein [Tepidisphaeraceae bacterium]
MSVRLMIAAALLLVAGVGVQAGGEAVERVPLRVDWPTEDCPRGFPVYCGLSLPRGLVTAAGQVSVVDGAGRAVPAGVELLAKWTPEPSYKWVGLRFVARKGVEYVAVVSPTAGAGVTEQLRVTKGTEAITVDTGVARFTLPVRGALVGRVEVGGVAVLDGGEACLLVTDDQGRTGDETRGAAPDEQPRVEASGPTFAVVRRAGAFRTAAGEVLARYVVRLEFQAGTAVVKAQHTLIHTRDTNGIQYADLSVRLKPAGPGPVEATFEPSPGAEPAGVSLNVAEGDAAYLMQAEYPHHGQKNSRRELKVHRAKGAFAAWATLGATPHAGVAGDWAAAQTSAGGVQVVVPNLARTFPKELEVGPEGLTAHLWSSRGGRLLDYRARTLVDHWGVDWVDAEYPGGSAAMRKLETNAQGSARTHDLWLNFFGPEGKGTVAAVGRAAGTTPLVVQDAQWMRRTEAMGFVHPRDVERFGALERFLDHFFEEYLVNPAERWGDYGFLDFGCGPHTYDKQNKLPAEDRPRLNYRYAGMMYYGQTALWQAWARGGARAYREYAQAFHRHCADYEYVHDARAKFPLGAHLGGVGQDAPLYWAGQINRPSGALGGHQGRDVQGFLLQHYLTGDRWALETMLKFGERFLADLDPAILPNTGANANGGQLLITPAALYAHTGDPRYLAKLEAIRAKMTDLRTGTGWVDTDYHGAFYKYPTHVAGAFADYVATGSAVARQVIEKSASLQLHDLPASDTGYQDLVGRFCAYGYRLTGDVRYAEHVAERFDRVLFEYTDGRRGYRNVSAIRGGPHQGGTHGFNFFETAFLGMDLLVQTEGKRGPYVALDTGIPSHPVDVWFSKDWHEPVSVQARARPGPDLQVRWSPGGEEKHRPGRDYHDMPIRWDFRPVYYTKDAPGLGGGFVRADLGPETVAGEYRLVNVPLVFKCSAKRLVMHAPDGVILRATSARPPTWYFRLPAGKQGRVFVSKPVTVMVEGKAVEVKPGEWTTLRGGANDQMASMTTSGLVYVAFRGGIPPVLAQHDPQLYFVPREVAAGMPVREAEVTPGPDGKAVYTAGVSGKEGDSAVLMTPGRALRIPRGKRVGDRQYELIDYRQGTLEFWFRPRWSTGGMTGDGGGAAFLSGGFWPCTVRHAGGDDEDEHRRSAIVFNAPATAKAPAGALHPYPAQQLLNLTPVSEGRWHHFAVCWTTDAKRGWISEVYVDGKPATGVGRHDVGLGRYLESQIVKHGAPLPWPIDEPKGEFLTLVGAALDAAVDDLRVSKVARYPEPFSALRKTGLEFDEETLLLMKFDKSVEAKTGEGVGRVRVRLVE